MKPYIKKFNIPSNNGLLQITSIVMDQEDFNNLCDEIAGVFNIGSATRMDADQVQQLKELGHIPLVQRGTKTEFLFERYSVETDKVSVIVRGKGMEVFERMVSN